MSRSNELRKLIQSRLKTICENVYYKDADKSNLYPHIVYNLRSVDLGDLVRKDYIVDVDIWHKGENAKKAVEDLADLVEDLFNAENLPNVNILPTFFLNDRKNIEDEDKTIQRCEITLQTQLYRR